MRCSRCGVAKDPSEFEFGKRKCCTCRAKCLEYYNEHRQECIERAKRSLSRDRDLTNYKKRERNRKYPQTYLLGTTRRRAKALGIVFNLEKSDIPIPEKCPLLGVSLRMGDGFAKPNSPSVDRIIPEYGYVKGNVQVISHRANTIKNNASLSELKLLVRNLKRIVKEKPDESCRGGSK